MRSGWRRYQGPEARVLVQHAEPGALRNVVPHLWTGPEHGCQELQGSIDLAREQPDVRLGVDERRLQAIRSCSNSGPPDDGVHTVGEPASSQDGRHEEAALGTHDLDSIVSASPDKIQAAHMLDDLTVLTDRAALEQYGINVVDVRIKRLNLPEQNKQSVYARMRAERERIARQYRAEGEEQALSIRADADRQREEILSVAYKQAEKTKGEGDAESTRIYGQAYSKNPKLYKLLRTLEAYKKILDDKTTAILSSDSELLKILTRGQSGAQ